MSDPLTDSPAIAPSTSALNLSTTPPNDPPPPYPSRERRRTTRTGRRRRTTGMDSEHLQVSSTGNESDYDIASAAGTSPFPMGTDTEHEATENTPLLGSTSPRILSGGISGRQRTLSLTSTLQSATSFTPSFAQTVLSAFHPDRDCDLDSEVDSDHEHSQHDFPGSRPAIEEQSRLFATELSGPQIVRRGAHPIGGPWRKYFRPMTRRAYYSALLHLLVLNFPFALVAWLYLFVFTLTGTTTLVALPLGAVLCFFDLLGARAFSRGELSLQSTFHGPLAFSVPCPSPPIFTRVRMPTASEVEAGIGPIKEHSFYRNAYSMFTDPTSYQALFYFLVIKPGITLLLSLALVIFVPLAFIFILPAPAMLRLVRRLGIWQANIAVEGLYHAVR